MTATERIDAALVLLGTPFIAGVLLLVTFAVAWTVCYERRLRANPYMAPWADRAPGELPEVER